MQENKKIISEVVGPLQRFTQKIQENVPFSGPILQKSK